MAAKFPGYEALWCETEKRWLKISNIWNPHNNPSGCGKDQWRAVTTKQYRELKSQSVRTRVGVKKKGNKKC